MIKDVLLSFRDSIKEKTTNPFLGTFIFVWVIRNWRLIYTFFYMDSELTLNERMNKLSAFFADRSFLGDLGLNILITFGVLILTYVLINITRYITNRFENQLTPWIYKKSDYKSLVTKDDYNKLKINRDSYIRSLDEKDRSLTNLKDEYDKLSEQIRTNSAEYGKLQGENRNLQKDLNQEKKENKRLEENMKLMKNNVSWDINDIIGGKWIKTRESMELEREEPKAIGKVELELKMGNQCFSNDSFYCNIDMVDYDLNEGLLSFRMKGVDEEGKDFWLINDLKIIDKNTMQGSEHDQTGKEYHVYFEKR